MSDSSKEFYESIPRTETQFGMWIRPFADYRFPSAANDNLNEASKMYGFSTPGFGNWNATLIWHAKGIADLTADQTGKKALIIVPDGEIIVPLQELDAVRKKLETRLMQVLIGKESGWTEAQNIIRNVDPNIYSITARTPSGKELTQETGFSPFSGWRLGEEKIKNIFVLDSTPSAKGLEIRPDTKLSTTP